MAIWNFVQVQTMSITMNLLKVSIVTTLYQRFKTQKIGGKDYPWYKSEKYELDSGIDDVDGVIPRSRMIGSERRRRTRRRTGIIYATKENAKKLQREYESRNPTPLPLHPRHSQRRPSSDLYMLPSGIVGEDEVDGVPLNRETSIVDGPPRRIYRLDADQVDGLRNFREIKSLPEDDIAGKLIACLWWLCFFIARILAISSFAYFYPRDIIWLLAIHFIICEAFLIYDVKTYVVRQSKAVFYIFIGLVYIFCIIEFMKQFKKGKFIYYGFFALVYVENLATCLVWWFSNLESEEIQNDWWFRFIFFSVLGSTVLSLSSMMFYLVINKPKKVVVDEELVEGNPL